MGKPFYVYIRMNMHVYVRTYDSEGYTYSYWRAVGSLPGYLLVKKHHCTRGISLECFGGVAAA